jgi:acyl-CoA hydrolase
MEASPGTASATESVVARWMSPQDANRAGNVHGGTIMQMCDEVAAVAATRHCRRRVVTAAMDQMRFRSPVLVGNLLTLRASVNATWRTSMEVGVRVDAEDVQTGEVSHTSSAYLTFVALDEHGKPIDIPPVVADSPHAERRQRQAQLRRQLRLAGLEELARAAMPPT